MTKKIIISVSVMALLILLALVYVKINSKSLNVAVDKPVPIYVSITSSLLGNNSAAIKSIFLEGVKKGDKSADVKAAAYFVQHRYFDNGGDIYEIYDYVKAHPELSFLNEAEKIEPEIFKAISDRTFAPKKGFESGMRANLAYIEVLAKYDYVDMAGLNTIANKSLEIAYNTRSGAIYSKDKEADIKSLTEKAKYFLDKSTPEVAGVMSGKLTSKDIAIPDIVVGLNQYASALRLMKAMKIDYKSEVTAEQVFTFNTEYVRKYYAPLVFFTDLSNAGSLVLQNGSSTNVAEFDNILKDFYAADFEKRPNMKSGTLFRGISKLGKKDNGLYCLYCKNSIMSMSSISPKFKDFLITKLDFVEADFKAPEKINAI